MSDQQPERDLADILDAHMKEAGLGATRLANQVNQRFEIPNFLTKRTLENWQRGRAKTVQDWRQLTAVATILRLDETETNALLQAAGQATISELWESASEEDRRFLTYWTGDAPIQDIAQRVQRLEAITTAQSVSDDSEKAATAFENTQDDSTKPHRSSRQHKLAIILVGLIMLAALLLIFSLNILPNNAQIKASDQDDDQFSGLIPTKFPTTTPSMTSSPTTSPTMTPQPTLVMTETPTSAPEARPTITPVNIFIGSSIIETIWQDNQSWIRKVPVLDSNPQLEFAEDWAESFSIDDYPGEGNLQASSEFIIGNTVYLSIWRNNEGWLKTAPIVNGRIQWSQSSQWSGPLSIGEFPGRGDIQALGDSSTGTILHRSLWRENEGWFITVPIQDGNVRWSQAQWTGPISLEILPGEGEVQATSITTIGPMVQQTYIRNNQRWTRMVPVKEGHIEWGEASEWSGPLSNNMSINENDIQALSDTDLP